MRKVEVKRTGEHYCDVDGVVKLVGDVKHWLGEYPQVGKTRTYYIIPAGDVAEFELQCHGAGVKHIDPQWEGGSGMLPTSMAHQLSDIIPHGETRRVTAIVHPADEPKEETVEANEPDWLSEPDDVGVWWLWDKKSPPVLCSVYDRFDDRYGFLCRTFNGITQFTADLAGSHLFCRLEYVDLQQWYFKRGNIADEPAVKTLTPEDARQMGIPLDVDPPAKQPITLKRNNTPTREGNYAMAATADVEGEVVRVRRRDEIFGGGIGIFSDDGQWYHCSEFPFWSDELGPIEFEAVPEPPPKLRQGWFEHQGVKYAVAMNVGKFGMVDPALDCRHQYTVGELRSKGITITWYGDDA